VCDDVSLHFNDFCTVALLQLDVGPALEMFDLLKDELNNRNKPTENAHASISSSLQESRSCKLV